MINFQALGEDLGQYIQAVWATKLKKGGIKNIGMAYKNLQVAVCVTAKPNPYVTKIEQLENIFKIKDNFLLLYGASGLS
jgi:hypothetical protein